MNLRCVDPVCGIEITAEEAADSAEFDGETYYLCSPGCRAPFEAAPERYIRPMAGGAR